MFHCPKMTCMSQSLVERLNMHSWIADWTAGIQIRRLQGICKITNFWHAVCTYRISKSDCIKPQQYFILMLHRPVFRISTVYMWWFTSVGPGVYLYLRLDTFLFNCSIVKSFRAIVCFRFLISCLALLRKLFSCLS